MKTDEKRRSFLVHLKGALQCLGPVRFETDYGAPHREMEPITAAITNWALWLRKDQLRGFDPMDYPELSADDAIHMQRSIETYEVVARQWVGNRRPDSKSLTLARDALLEICSRFREILERQSNRSIAAAFADRLELASTTGMRPV